MFRKKCLKCGKKFLTHEPLTLYCSGCVELLSVETTTYTATPKKIYCKDCKSFKGYCTYMKNSHKFDEITGEKIEIEPFEERWIYSNKKGEKPYIIKKEKYYNKNNDCKYFKQKLIKKWWDFWK